MKAIVKKILGFALLCTLVLTAIPVQNTQAANNKFEVSVSNVNPKNVSVYLPSDGTYKEVQVLNSSKQVWKTEKCYSFALFELKKNKTATIRYRVIDIDGTPLSDWSKTIGLITSAIEPKQEGKKTQVSYKMPKIKGVIKYKISISDKRNKGFKKIKTVKPGKKIIIKNFKGKVFKSYKNYYIQIQPIIKNTKTYTKYISGFYFTKLYF